MEAVVAVSRVAKGLVFVPLAMGGSSAKRLARWLEGMETTCLAAMRRLDAFEAWATRADVRRSRFQERRHRPCVLC